MGKKIHVDPGAASTYPRSTMKTLAETIAELIASSSFGQNYILEHETSMSLAEAIKHAEEVGAGCGPCAKDHRQLAAWLQELRSLRPEDRSSEETSSIRLVRVSSFGKARDKTIASLFYNTTYKEVRIKLDYPPEEGDVSMVSVNLNLLQRFCQFGCILKNVIEAQRPD